MTRVVYNAKYGGFGLDEDVIKWVRANAERLYDEYPESDVIQLEEVTISGEYYDDGSGPKSNFGYIHDTELDRDNELLAEIVEGNTSYDGKINSTHSKLQVAHIPEGVEWEIDQYDGLETVREKTRTFS